jgi:hypothetical protein
MKINLRQYGKILEENGIRIIYSGPIWSNGIDGMAEIMLKRLEFDEMPLSASQAVFSIFVEQINNVMMYSDEKEQKNSSEGQAQEISGGIFIMGVQDDTYFVQSGNVVTDGNAEILKNRMDYLNTLDKKELRQYYKQQMNAENDNPESKGAGIGLTEIARRASGQIEYEFEPCGEGRQYFTMYATVQQGGKDNGLSH